MKKIILLSAVALGFAMTSCESDGEPPRTYENVTVDVYSQYTIPNSEDCAWKSGNPVVATVDGDVVSTHYVGVAKIWCAKGSFNVDVKPLHTLYVDPNLTWGLTSKALKNSINKDAYGSPLSETDTQVVYGPNKEVEDQFATSYTYNFEEITNDKGKIDYVLYSVVVDLETTVTAEQVKDALTERYVPVQGKEGMYKATDGSFTVESLENAGITTITYTVAE